MGIRIPLLGTVLLMLVASLTVEAWQFKVVHKYAHLAGSPANSDDGSMSPEYLERLVEHHHQRRRLFAAAVFPLGGNGDPIGPNAIGGLYFAAIALGTPVQVFYVQVDTGSNVLWVDCAPCTGCPTNSSIPGVTVDPYNPTASTTSTSLPCSSQYCAAASDEAAANCDANGACAFDILYGDNSNVTGTIFNDAFTFLQVPNTTASGTATANIFFGCGSILGGFEDSPVGGLIGFAKAAVSVPSQLAAQNLTAYQFAHCLEGDSTIGGGIFAIANVSEPDIVYTPQIPQQVLYNVGLQNIAVNGVNVTTAAEAAASFDISPGVNGGVIVDSGTTLATIAEPAYTAFVNAVTSLVTATPIAGPIGTNCWPSSGDVATAFPSVTLLFDGAVMNLGPKNYLFPVTDSAGTLYQCLGWLSGTSSTGSSITILGDIVLKDQLVVYDNDLQRIGWKPFNCSDGFQITV